MLYEDPDATDIGDRDLIKELNLRLMDDPTYPIPEGYFKVKEKTPIYDYTLPESILDIVSEEKVLCIEVLDEIIFEIMGFHFIEPQISYDELMRVKPKVKNMFKPKAEALNYMKKVEKKARFNATSELGRMSAAEKIKNSQEIKPRLGLVLKMEVA